MLEYQSLWLKILIKHVKFIYRYEYFSIANKGPFGYFDVFRWRSPKFSKALDQIYDKENFLK